MSRSTLVMLALAALAFVFFWSSSRRAQAAAGEARDLVAAGAKLVDVRTPEEFAQGHVKGAVNIPVSDLERRMKELGPKDAPLVVYCRSGARSARATRLLKSQGYGKVLDIGPMPNW